MRKKTSLKDIAVIRLALFAMFFQVPATIFPLPVMVQMQGTSGSSGLCASLSRTLVWLWLPSSP